MSIQNLPFARYVVDDVCEIMKGKNYLEINIKRGLFDEAKISRAISTLDSITKKEEYRVLINCEPGAKITFKGLKYLASSQAMRYATAKAYILNTFHQRIMGRVFSFLVHNKIPIKLFTSRNDAKEWLENLVVL